MLKKISSTIQTQQDVAVLEDTVANQKRQIASLEQKLSKHEQLSADYQTQQSRLEKYERKLRDLVSAYQSVVKEKEALKQIVQSFDSTSLVSVSTDHDDTVSIASETSVNEPEDWQQRIQNLQSAVNTLSDEKNKMESAYICEKKKLRQQVEELEEKITEVENQLKEEQSRCEGLASQLKQCNESLEVMRNEWQRAQNDLSLQEYRKDQEDAMEALKVQFEQMKSSLAEERVKALLVENAASNAVKRAEERVGKMENELRELSAAVGAYESLRTTDQNAIEHLRNQIDQLHIENSMLAKAVGHDTPSDSNLTTEHLHSKYIHFRDLLRTACTTSEIPFPGDEETSHLKHEIDKLKKECERYKESFSRNSLSTKKNDSSNEKVVNLQEKNCYLRHQLNAATSKCSQLQAELEALTTKHSSELHSLKKEHSYSLDELERKWSNKLRQTELDASAYRDRVQTILDENELEKQDLLSQVHKNEESPLSPTKTSSTLLHWTEERARWQRELTTIRDERHSLQSQVRGLQSIRSLNEDEWNSKFQLLKKEIEVLQKRVSREGSNLEYLKNVFFNFLTCREPSARSNMLTAIMNVIQFTSSEVEQVRTFQKTLWW